MPDNLSPMKHCGSYAPGHTPHWLQVRRAATAGWAPALPGRLVAVDGQRLTLVLDDGETVHLFNHETPRLAAQASAVAFRVSWLEDSALLLLPNAGAVFSVHRDVGREPGLCPAGTSPTLATTLGAEEVDGGRPPRPQAGGVR